MSGSEEKSGANTPNRTGLILKLTVAGVFLIALGAVSVWVVATYLNEPDKVVVALPEGTPPGAAVSLDRLPPPPAPMTAAPNPARTITGNVTDATTHQPVAAFSVRVGYGFPQNPGQYFNQAGKDFTGGEFRTPSARTNGNQQSLVRIEAHGYLPMVLEVQGSEAMNFALTPAKDLQGRVLSADGTPQAGVLVLVAAMPGTGTLINSDPKKMVGLPYTQTSTRADGIYDLPPQNGRFLLAAVGSDGYGEADQDALAKSPDIHLAAWGRLVGTLKFETKPAADVQLNVNSGVMSSPANEPRVYQSVGAKTAADGTFSVEKIAPGPVQVSRTVTHQGAQMRYGQSEILATVNIAPGETATVNIGGAGRPVVGKLVVPSGVNVNDYLINAYATANNTADLPALMPENIKHAPPGPQQVWMRNFLQTPEGQEYQKTHPDAAAGPHRYMLVIDDQSNFRMENVTPGDYQISINLQSMQGRTQISQASARFTMPEIPGGVSEEPLEIDDIHISAPRAPAGAQGNLVVNGQGANQPTFTGSVVDAATHQPVKNFTARIGFAQGANSIVNYFDQPQQFTGGQYRLTSNMGGRFSGWYVRIEAHGYLPAVSPAMTGAGTQDFELTAAKDLQGTVFSPDGKPAAGATLAVALPGMQTNINLNSNSQMIMIMPYTQTTADGQGKYDLTPQSGNFAVVAYSDQGYAQVNQDALAASSDIHLAAWGRIQGKVMSGTKPQPGEQLWITSGDTRRRPDEPIISFQMQSMSGPDGAFRVDQVPPGPVQIARTVIETAAQGMMTRMDQPTTVAVAAGETASVIVGGVGRPVEGKLIFAPGISPDDYYLNGAAVGGIMEYPPQMPDDVKAGDFAAKMAWMQRFAQSQAGREYLTAHPVAASQKRYAMEVAADHTFRFLNVTPGDYQLMITLQLPQGGQGPPVRTTFTMPDIPGGVSDEPLVIPDVKVRGN